jgi:hypothetical protein
MPIPRKNTPPQQFALGVFCPLFDEFVGFTLQRRYGRGRRNAVGDTAKEEGRRKKEKSSEVRKSLARLHQGRTSQTSLVIPFCLLPSTFFLAFF